MIPEKDIPDEAIEAAAEALVSSTLGDRPGINWEEFFEAARGALKAAAPYMLATAWDAGHSAGDGDQSAMWDARLAGKPAKYADVHTRNPYRSQA